MHKHHAPAVLICEAPWSNLSSIFCSDIIRQRQITNMVFEIGFAKYYSILVLGLYYFRFLQQVSDKLNKLKLPFGHVCPFSRQWLLKVWLHTWAEVISRHIKIILMWVCLCELWWLICEKKQLLELWRVMRKRSWRKKTHSSVLGISSCILSARQ